MANLKVVKNEEVKSIHVAIVLDRSGSMSSIRNEVIGAFNEQIKTIGKEAEEVDTDVSFFTFSTKADDPVFLNQPVEKMELLTEKGYVPDGMTAMLDGVGKAVSHLEQVKDANDPGTAFLVIVVSDGQENNSKEYNWISLAAKIKPLQETKRWTFSYVGANQDLGKVSDSINIGSKNVMSFTCSANDVHRVSGDLSRGISSYYGRVKTAGTFAGVDKGFFVDDKGEKH
jgi:Mg-chelatase subunit ChlD